MSDKNTAPQSSPVSLIVRKLAGDPAQIEEQMRIHREQVEEMTESRRKLNRDNDLLRSDVKRLKAQRDLLKSLTGGSLVNHDDSTRVARVELLTWLLMDSAQIVIIDDNPLLVGTDRNEWDCRRVAEFIATILESERLPTVHALERVLRARCVVCQEVDCEGHGAGTTDLVIPQRVREALAAVESREGGDARQQCA